LTQRQTGSTQERRNANAGCQRTRRTQQHLVVRIQEAVGPDKRHRLAADDHRLLGGRIDHYRRDGVDERDRGHRRNVGEHQVGAGRGHGAGHGEVVAGEVLGRGERLAFDDDAAGGSLESVVIADPDRGEGGLQKERLLERRADAAQHQVVRGVAAALEDGLVDLRAGHAQVVVGPLEAQVERIAEARQTAEAQWREAGEHDASGEPGLVHQRLFEARGDAEGAGKLQRVAHVLAGAAQAAADDAEGEAVADGDVA
jgi:hypothetical protein